MCFPSAAGFGFRAGERKGRSIELLIRNAENTPEVDETALHPVRNDEYKKSFKEILINEKYP